MARFSRCVALLLSALLLVCLAFPASAAAVQVYGNEPETNSTCCLLYEAKSGEVLYQVNADQKAYPASTTKIMTALLALKYCDTDEIVTYTKEARAGLDLTSSIAGLKVGECLTMYDMLKCLLVASGNDAANAIAFHVGGSIAKFVEMMNDEAAELGCTGTHFTNANGLQDEDHYTTARDLLIMTLAAMDFPVFCELVSQAQVTVEPTNKYSKTRYFNNTNMLLSQSAESMYLYSKATGVKTGHTSEAGYCLVSSAEDEDLSLICVILGGSTYFREDIKTTFTTSYQDSLRLYRWAFSNFGWHTILSRGKMVTEVKVEQGEGKDYVLLTPVQDVSVLAHKDENIDSIYSFTVSAEQSVAAPVLKDTVLGNVTVLQNGKVLTRVDLVASADVTRSAVIYRLESLKNALSQNWVKILLILFIIAVICYTVFVILYNKRRRQRRGNERTRRYRKGVRR